MCLFLLLVICSFHSKSQTTVTFTIEQPETPFEVDAGPDLVYIGESLGLGGEPSAIGGFGEYAYSWEPAEALDDAGSANPNIIDLVGPTTFTLECTDVQGNCVKEDEVFVDFQLSTTQQGNYNLSIYPNPFDEQVQIKSDLPISQMTVFDITGKTLTQLNNLGSTYQWNTHQLNSGIYLIQIQLENGTLLNQKLCKRN